jgi:hypothetical protein
VTVSQVVQYAAGVACLGYALVLVVQQARTYVGRRRVRTPVDDLRLVIDLAARLRDQGKASAVVVCQKLLDELLQPEAPKP